MSSTVILPFDSPSRIAGVCLFFPTSTRGGKLLKRPIFDPFSTLEIAFWHQKGGSNGQGVKGVKGVKGKKESNKTWGQACDIAI